MAPGPGLVNLANALTVLRLMIVPVFVAFLVAGGTGWRVAAFFAFGIASLTDLLDGELARRRRLITDFGKIADPIADKALTGSALITLSALGELSWWATGVIMAREVGVTALRFWVIRRGVIPASRGGKIKTVLQLVAIGLYILPVHVGLVRPVVLALAVAVTLITGADYVARAVRLRRAVPAQLTASMHAAAGGPPPGAVRPAGPQAGPPRTMAGDQATADELAAKAIGLLIASGHTVATAESLTGGLVAAALTTVPGASAVFRGGVVAYSAELKTTLLAVPGELLDRHGTVHADVALAMAAGARERLGAWAGLATTGVAGPDPVDGQQPGIVHIAVDSPQGAVHQPLRLSGDRAQIRQQTVSAALTLLIGALQEDGPTGR
jgi:CDP-diacylglycerol---glycerol-3-phosphate 3-phosphatidyltransferase